MDALSRFFNVCHCTKEFLRKMKVLGAHQNAFVAWGDTIQFRISIHAAREKAVF